MEYGFPILKGTDIAEDVLQDLTGPVCMLAHPVGGVGIGTDGDDLAAQLLKSPEIVGNSMSEVLFRHILIELHSI